MKVPPVNIGAPTIVHDSLTEALASLALLGALHRWTPRRLPSGLPYSEEVANLAVSRELIGARSKSCCNLEKDSAIGSPAEELS